MSDFYDQMNESFKDDTGVFFNEDSVALRKRLIFTRL